jgi:hypothetical protein
VFSYINYRQIFVTPGMNIEAKERERIREDSKQRENSGEKREILYL